MNWGALYQNPSTIQYFAAAYGLKFHSLTL